MKGMQPLEKLARELFWIDLRRPASGKSKAAAWRDLSDAARARWSDTARHFVVQLYFLGDDYVNVAHGLGAKLSRQEIARMNAAMSGTRGTA